MSEIDLDISIDDLPTLDIDETSDDTDATLSNPPAAESVELSIPKKEGDRAEPKENQASQATVPVSDNTAKLLADLGFLAVLVQEGHETFEKHHQLGDQQLEKINKLQKSIKGDLMELQALFEYEDATNYRKLCESTTALAENAVKKLEAGIQQSQTTLDRAAREATKHFSFKLFGIAIATGVVSALIIASMTSRLWLGDMREDLAVKTQELAEAKRSMELGRSLHMYVNKIYPSLTDEQKNGVDSIYISQGFDPVGAKQ